MFKNYFLLVSILISSIVINAQTIFINEIHYDDVSTDENEGVEIAASEGLNLSCYELHFYNGSDSLTDNEDKIILDGIVENQSNGFGFVWIAVEGLQNGGADGIALYDSCTEIVIQFLSYEGMVTAINGPANETISVDIGVGETNDTEEGTSLQLTGTGTNYADFVWSPSQPATPGNINLGQSFGEGETLDASLNILSSDETLAEDVGEIEIKLQATNLTEDFEISISLGEGSATLDSDYTISDEVISVSADEVNQTLTSTITIIDDEEEEDNETITINFGVDNENITLNKTSITITIEDNDAPKVELPQYSIADVTTENMEGVADSTDVKCKLTGVVQGINLFDPGSLLFTIHDGTAGISVFNGETDFGYTVAPGDEITVEGTIGQFRGLTQITADAITLISSENTLQEFKEVSTLDESTESENVFLTDLSIVDESQWNGEGSGSNVEFKTQSGETILVRIDDNAPLFSLPFSDIGTADGSFTVYGIGGQYDGLEAPHVAGYQLFPMKVSDVQQISVGIEQITSGKDIEILSIGSNNFRVIALQQIQNLKAYEMNGKEISITQNKNEFTLNTSAKGIYLITLEMDEQIYSTKISIR